MKFSKTTNKKISIALGILAFVAAGVLLLGSIWGFNDFAKQIFTSITGLCGLSNIYFLGSTTQKVTEK